MPWTEDDLSLALGELRDEPLPAEALARVRSAVMARVERPRRRWLWWLAPIPVAAALTAILIPRPVEVAPPPLIAKAPPQAQFMHPKPAAQPKQAPTQPRFLPTAQDGLVRLASNRNDIVIYWDLTDNEGEVQ